MTQNRNKIFAFVLMLAIFGCQKKDSVTSDKNVIEGDFIDASTNQPFNPFISNKIYLREGTTLGLSTLIATTTANSAGHYRFELSSPLVGSALLRVITDDTLLVQDAYTLNIPVASTVICNVQIPCGATWSRSFYNFPTSFDDSLFYEITCGDWINRGGALFFRGFEVPLNVRLRANKANIAHFTYFKNGSPVDRFDTLNPACRAVIRDTIEL